MSLKTYGRTRRAAATGAALLAVLAADASFAGVGDDCPPNAEPGKCYEKVYRPAQYENYVEQEVGEPSYQQRQILVRPETTEVVNVPAVYRTVTETVVVRPATVRQQVVPAVYETVTEQVLVRPAHTEWKRGMLLDRTEVAPGRTKMLPSGEVLCLVEVPAEYRTETRQVLRSPARTIDVVEPAQTREVSRQVLVTPAHVEQRIVPAQYRTVTEQVQGGYRTVTRQRQIRAASLGWQEISCNYTIPAPRAR